MLSCFPFFRMENDSHSDTMFRGPRLMCTAGDYSFLLEDECLFALLTRWTSVRLLHTRRKFKEGVGQRGAKGRKGKEQKQRKWFERSPVIKWSCRFALVARMDWASRTALGRHSRHQMTFPSLGGLNRGIQTNGSRHQPHFISVCQRVN